MAVGRGLRKRLLTMLGVADQSSASRRVILVIVRLYDGASILTGSRPCLRHRGT